MVSRDTRISTDAALADAIKQFYADPLGHVMFSYPWNTDPAIQVVELAPRYRKRYDCQFGPDEWACEFLDWLASEIKRRKFDGKHAVAPIQACVVSGHGIGKSTLVAWLIKFIMDTRPFCKGTVTAMTDVQLQSKTWAELGKWNRLSATSHWFDYQAGRGNMSFRHRQFPNEWFTRAQTSKKENSESFAGQHAANSTSFYIFDEASGIADVIDEVRVGGLTDGEPMSFDFGNPTRNSGFFYEHCVGKYKHRYKVFQIDSRSVAVSNKEYLQSIIDDHGIDSDRAKVRVLGQFPSVGSLQFIPTGDVEEAMLRDVVPDRTAPLVIGVDVARYGEDNSVIYPRIGMDAKSFGFKEYSGLDTVQLAGKVIEMVREFRELKMETAAIFVDGGGIGGGVVDQLRHLGYPVQEVQFGAKPTDTGHYRYKVGEIWGKMRDALHTRLAIPDDSNLKEQLTNREYEYMLGGDRIHLEPKSEMKDRGVNSPDIADALALTFAQDVSPTIFIEQGVQQMTTFEYDPLEQAW